MDLRLKAIRRAAGLTQEQLAERMGVDRVHVSRIESGARRANTEFLENAARALDVPVSDLFPKPEIPVVGYIGAGAEFNAIDDHAQGGGLDRIDAPPGCPSNAVAVVVRGSSMLPIYFDGDILIYSDKRYDVESFVNRRGVCGLADSRVLVKTITRGSADGLYTLTSFNSGPIEDVALEWIARIEWVQPK